MLIGINLLYLIPGHVGGTETYARELIPVLALENKLVIFCSHETAPTFEESKNIKIVTIPVNSNNRVARILAEQTILPVLCMTNKLDILFSLGYSAPVFHPCPSVVTIHDLNWYYHPEDFTQLNRIFWEYLTRASAVFSTHIITDSVASADSIKALLNVKNDKVTPILHGVPTRIVAKPAKRKNPYIFTVLAGYPHKNLSTLLKAFSELTKNNKNIELVICGLGGKADSANTKLIDNLDIGSKVTILGYVSREELASLYMGAEVFVFPSAYEGFGYPVLEAMSYGAPVVSSNAFSLREVVGDAGILVDPYDVSGYIGGIKSILGSKQNREHLIRSGNKRASELQWDKTAKLTLEILRKATEK